MLIAIGIYQAQHITTSSVSFHLENSAQIKNQFNIFKPSFLKNCEITSLASLTAKDLNHCDIFHFQPEDEHHYCKRINMTTPLYMVIVSRSKLDIKEVTYLFRNIEHAHIRSKAANITLQMIIDNPLGYTGKDCYTQTLNAVIHRTKEELIHATEKLIERGEKTRSLKAEIIQLEEVSKELLKEAKKLNSCCRVW